MPSHDLSRFEGAGRIFRDHGGIMRTAEAIRAGVNPRTLYAMVDEGVLERLSRGLYRLMEMVPLGNPDLVSVALKAPRGVICLISARSYYGPLVRQPRSAVPVR